MKDFKFDKTAFKIQTFKEADAANILGKEVPYIERLRQAYVPVLTGIRVFHVKSA